MDYENHQGVPYRNVLTDNYTCSRGPSQIKFSMYNPVLLASGRRSKGDEKKNKRNKRSFARERHRRILRTHATLRAFLRSQKRLPGEVPYITFLPSTLPAHLTQKKRNYQKRTCHPSRQPRLRTSILRHVSLLQCVKCVCTFWTYLSIGPFVQSHCKS